MGGKTGKGLKGWEVKPPTTRWELGTPAPWCLWGVYH